MHWWERIYERSPHEAVDRFKRTNADLLALTKNGADDVVRRMSAAIFLDRELMETASAHHECIVQPNDYARQVGREGYARALDELLAKAFTRIQRNCVVRFAAKLTPEAERQLEDLEILAGEREARPVVPPAAPPKSAQEQLEDQVREDWLKLSTDKVRAKSNSAYKQVLDRLLASDQLKSVCTLYTDGSTEWR